MAKRPDLSSLPIGQRLERRPQPAEAPAAAASPKVGRQSPRDPARDYKTVMARINRRGWEQLRFLSAEKDMPLEEMIIEALNSFLGQNGKPAIIEKRKRPED